MTWLAPHDGKPGRPAVFFDAAIQFCLTIKVLFIPIRRNGRPWKEDCPAAIARNETLRATRHDGRAFWKRWLEALAGSAGWKRSTGYHVRSRIEAKMRCLKSFGARIACEFVLPESQWAQYGTLFSRIYVAGKGRNQSSHPPALLPEGVLEGQR